MPTDQAGIIIQMLEAQNDNIKDIREKVSTLWAERDTEIRGTANRTVVIAAIVGGFASAIFVVLVGAAVFLLRLSATAAAAAPHH